MAARRYSHGGRDEVHHGAFLANRAGTWAKLSLKRQIDPKCGEGGRNRDEMARASKKKASLGFCKSIACRRRQASDQDRGRSALLRILRERKDSSRQYDGAELQRSKQHDGEERRFDEATVWARLKAHTKKDQGRRGSPPTGKELGRDNEKVLQIL